MIIFVINADVTQTLLQLDVSQLSLTVFSYSYFYFSITRKKYQNGGERHPKCVGHHRGLGSVAKEHFHVLFRRSDVFSLEWAVVNILRS